MKGYEFMDYKEFTDKIDCIVRNIEDNLRRPKELVKGGTVKDLGKEFKRQYLKLRPYKKEWHLPIPMKKSNLKTENGKRSI